MNKTLLIAALAFTFVGFTTTSASAKDACERALKHVDSTAKATVGVCEGLNAVGAACSTSDTCKHKRACTDGKCQYNCEAIAKVGQTVKALVKALKSALKIGPNDFEFNYQQTGKIVGIGKKIWISRTAAGKKFVKIDMKKIDGKKKEIKVNVCKFKKTEHTKKGTWKPYSAGSWTLTGSKVIALPDDLKGQYIAVELVGKGVTKNWKYEMTISNSNKK